MSSLRERFNRNSSDINELVTFSAIVFVVSLIWTATPAPGQFFSVLASIASGLVLFVSGIGMLFTGGNNAVTQFIAQMFVGPWTLLVKREDKLNGRYIDEADVFLLGFLCVLVLGMLGLLGGVTTGEFKDGDVVALGTFFPTVFWGIGILQIANWVVAYLFRIGGIMRNLSRETREAVNEIGDRFNGQQ